MCRYLPDSSYFSKNKSIALPMKQLTFLFLFFLISHILQAQTTNDTTAIKQLLERESSTWRSGDVKAHAACWQIQPYGVIMVSTVDGKSFVSSPAMMINPPANMMGKGGSAENSNYKFSVHGNDAWVSHDEVSTAADGSKSYSHELKILEKTNGEWKIVAMSIHMYKPE